MSDYKRVVSYLYKYENGRKGNNIGYIRIEVRKGNLKLYISMKDQKCVNQVPHKIYFYYHEGRKFQGVLAGDLSFANGEAQYRAQTDENNLFDTKMGLDDMGGMIVYYDHELAYGTEWDDIPIKMSYFETTKGATAEIADVSNQERVVQIIRTPNTDIILEDSKTEVEEKKSEPPVSVETEKREDAGDAVLAEEIDDAPEDAVEEFKDIVFQEQATVKEESLQEIQPEEPEETPVEKVAYSYPEEELTAFERILKECPKVSNGGNNQIVDCVRITPQDIGKLDISNWRLGNNSFLIHGYYNYHYIVLGKVIGDNGKRESVIGVPGVYGNQEKYLANQFGFKRFMPLKPTEVKTGSFGYWLVEIN